MELLGGGFKKRPQVNKRKELDNFQVEDLKK